MKIYNKIVIDIISGDILSEVSYEYSGIVAECKGGGGGGGQGGTVSYPAYMETQHGLWLDEVASDITAARAGNSPYFGATAYDPTTPLANMDTAITAFTAIVDALNNEADWNSAITQAKTSIDALIDATYINDNIVDYADIIDDQVDNITIPKFQRGLQDINAVQSSAFVLGEALIYGMRDRDVAKYGSDLKLKSNIQRNEMIGVGASEMLRVLLTKADLRKAVAHYTIEYNRMYIVAKKDQDDKDREYDELDAKWDLEMFQYGGNMMAAIGGGITDQETPKSRSGFGQALGGALSGAAAGWHMTGGTPQGAVMGGFIGLFAGLL